MIFILILCHAGCVGMTQMDGWVPECGNCRQWTIKLFLLMDSQQSMSQDLYLTLVDDTRLTSGVQIRPHATWSLIDWADKGIEPGSTRIQRKRPIKTTGGHNGGLEVSKYSGILSMKFVLLASLFVNLSTYLWFWLCGYIPITKIHHFSQALCYCCDCCKFYHAFFDI